VEVNQDEKELDKNFNDVLNDIYTQPASLNKGKYHNIHIYVSFFPYLRLFLSLMCVRQRGGGQGRWRWNCEPTRKMYIFAYNFILSPINYKAQFFKIYLVQNLKYFA
jgi:hypothetical protein